MIVLISAFNWETPFPDFELLDARIASALNKIIQNSYFKKRVGPEELKAQKQDRFLRGRQIAYLIYDCFQVTGVNDSVDNYAELFTISLRNDDIQEFDTRWNEILLSTEQFPPDVILESLYKLRIRGSEKLKTVLELYNLEIHQKKAKLDYHMLKTMVKRSIEHELRSRNFEARNGRIESNILVKNQRAQRRVHKGQGECWQWQANGQCTKGDQCSFRHDRNKRANATTLPTPSAEHTTYAHGGKNLSISKSPRGKSPSGKISRQPCKEHLQGTCTNPSRETWHSLECLLYKTETGCTFGDKCVFAHRRIEEQPSKRSKNNGAKSAVAMVRETKNLGCVFQTWSRRSLHRFYGRA